MSLPATLSPLPWNLPIVNADGTPTKTFLRNWASQRSINGAIPDFSGMPAHAIVLSEGGVKTGFIPPGSAGTLLIGQGAADPAFKALSQDAAITAGGVLTVTGLQGNPVKSGLPVDGQQLRWVNADGKWEAKPPFGLVIIDGTDTYVALVTSLTDPEVILSGGLPIYVKNPGISASFVRGVTDGSDAPAGFVGEYMSASLAVGSAINLTTNVAVDICSLNLTPGDWDVEGFAVFNPNGAGTTVNQLVAALTTTSATIPSDPNNGGNGKQSYSGFAPGSVDQIVDCGPMRMSISTNTTLYLDGRAQFGVSTMVAFGFMRARRVR